MVGLGTVLKGLAGTNTLAYFGPIVSDKEKKVLDKDLEGFNTLLGLITVLKGLAGTNNLGYFGPVVSDKKVFGQSAGGLNTLLGLIAVLKGLAGKTL